MDQEHPTSRLLREEGIAFFGAITASLSHEINNVLAIVSELSGLLGDLVHGAAAGRPLDPERLSGIAKRVSDQVERGKRLVKRLNRFAHTVDQPFTTVNVGETMELITTLCRRFADLKKVTLETEFPAEELIIESSAFGLMQAVHLCIDLALEAGEEGSNTVTTGYNRAEDDGCTIFVTGTAEVPLDERAVARLAYLAVLLEDLGGTVVGTPQTDPRRFVLHAPRKRTAGPAAEQDLGGV